MRLGDYAEKSEKFDKEGGDREKPKYLKRTTPVVCVWAADGGKQPPNTRYKEERPSRRYVFLFEIEESDSQGRRFTVNVNVPVRFGSTTKFGTLIQALGLDRDGDNYNPDAELPGAAVGLGCLASVDINEKGYPTFDVDDGKGLSCMPLMRGQEPMKPQKVYGPDEIPPQCEKFVKMLWANAMDMDSSGHKVPEDPAAFSAPTPGADDIPPEGPNPFDDTNQKDPF